MKVVDFLLIDRTEKGKSYFLRPQLIHLFSRLLDIDQELLSQLVIYKRTPFRYIPFYSSLNGGGAITLGSKSWQSITFTENYFSTDTDIYGIKAYGNKSAAFLDLLSHELGHIQHTLRFKYFWFYLIRFALEYLRYGHKDSVLELEAEKSREIFNDFVKYVEKHHGKLLIEHIICTDAITENEKFERINSYLDSYRTNSVK